MDQYLILKEIVKYGLHKELRPWEHCVYELEYNHQKHKDILTKFVNLTKLVCENTEITEIPKELVNLTKLWCENTNITEIPKELVNLTLLYCHNTNITEIPGNL